MTGKLPACLSATITHAHADRHTGQDSPMPLTFCPHLWTPLFHQVQVWQILQKLLCKLIPIATVSWTSLEVLKDKYSLKKKSSLHSATGTFTASCRDDTKKGLDGFSRCRLWKHCTRSYLSRGYSLTAFTGMGSAPEQGYLQCRCFCSCKSDDVLLKEHRFLQIIK